MNRSQWLEGLKYLTEKGLTIVTILDTQSIPDDLTAGIREQNISLEAYPRLILLANGGYGFWGPFAADNPDVEHPIDHYSIKITERFFETYLSGVSVIRIYPQAHQLPIQRLSRYAGWSFPSPLGMDIHPEFGLWYAYRSIYLIDSELPVYYDSYRQSPCEKCREKPCFDACPAGAVRGIEKFDTTACINHRLSEGSSCIDTCAARMACPAGAQHRYSADQMSYHYLYSYHAYQRYYEKRAAQDSK